MWLYLFGKVFTLLGVFVHYVPCSWCIPVVPPAERYPGQATTRGSVRYTWPGGRARQDCIGAAGLREGGQKAGFCATVKLPPAELGHTLGFASSCWVELWSAVMLSLGNGWCEASCDSNANRAAKVAHMGTEVANLLVW